jgi:hypothetical protein
MKVLDENYLANNKPLPLGGAFSPLLQNICAGEREEKRRPEPCFSSMCRWMKIIVDQRMCLWRCILCSLSLNTLR